MCFFFWGGGGFATSPKVPKRRRSVAGLPPLDIEALRRLIEEVAKKLEEAGEGGKRGQRVWGGCFFIIFVFFLTGWGGGEGV